MLNVQFSDESKTSVLKVTTFRYSLHKSSEVLVHQNSPFMSHMCAHVPELIDPVNLLPQRPYLAVWKLDITTNTVSSTNRDVSHLRRVLLDCGIRKQVNFGLQISCSVLRFETTAVSVVENCDKVSHFLFPVKLGEGGRYFSVVEHFDNVSL